MIKKLSKHGNSLALVIEKPILELLGIDADTEFNVTTDGGRLMLAPIAKAANREEVRSAYDEFVAKYPKMLQRLAE